MNAFLRHELLKVQERALLDLISHDHQNSQRKGIDLIFEYANWESSNVDEMPILEAFRKYKFYANYRDIEGIGRKLLFRHQQMGSWSSVNLEQIINELRVRYEGNTESFENRSSTPFKIESENSPRQLLSLAFQKAVSRTNVSISSIASDLDLDKRTVEKLIHRIMNKSFDPEGEKWTCFMDSNAMEQARKTLKQLI